VLTMNSVKILHAVRSAITAIAKLLVITHLSIDSNQFRQLQLSAMRCGCV